MKTLAIGVVGVVLALATFPVLFATGDAPGFGCTAAGDVAPILATIRALESGGNYTARAGQSTASGAYQFLDATWGNYAGYPSAWQAPPQVQDAKATEHMRAILDAHDGDISAVPVVWYIGHVPGAGSPEWDRIPLPGPGNTLTPRQYQQRWLARYEEQLTGPATGDSQQANASCAPGRAIDALGGGFAYPAPLELFAAARVEEPHHDYPAWDWMLPTGIPIYAIRGGRVVTVQYWPHNWWDAGCGHNTAGCATCGIGVTIEDGTGVRWAYCHGSAVHVQAGTTIPAGTRILSSGNTGRSSGPHLHLQIRTPDGQLRCPQPLLRTLRDRGVGLDPATLPTAGCSF